MRTRRIKIEKDEAVDIFFRQDKRVEVKHYSTIAVGVESPQVEQTEKKQVGFKASFRLVGPATISLVWKKTRRME